MSKTLGQIAFDRMQENPKMKMVWLWPWDQQSPWVQEAWEAAAQAVAKRLWTGIPLTEMQAVIEAARALFRGYTVEDSSADAWRCDDVLDHRLHDLFLKVEALDKAEVGDE